MIFIFSFFCRFHCFLFDFTFLVLFLFLSPFFLSFLRLFVSLISIWKFSACANFLFVVQIKREKKNRRNVFAFYLIFVNSSSTASNFLLSFRLNAIRFDCFGFHLSTEVLMFSEHGICLLTRTQFNLSLVGFSLLCFVPFKQKQINVVHWTLCCIRFAQFNREFPSNYRPCNASHVKKHCYFCRIKKWMKISEKFRYHEFVSVDERKFEGVKK